MKEKQVTINLRKLIADEKIADEVSQEVETALSDIVRAAVSPQLPFEVGKNYLIRTITMVDVGRVTKIVGKFIVMDDASWIADTGRFFECLRKSDVFIEVEPFQHPIFVNTDAIVDATLWPLALPTKAK